MENKLVAKLMLARKKASREITINVTGFSMEPTLFEGDSIKIIPNTSCCIGDILVFLYKEDELLVHRLLKLENEIFYCKGDNAFRLEDFTEDRLIGSVTEAYRNGKMLELTISKELQELSYAVNREFRSLGYDTNKAKQSEIYKKYQALMKSEKGE